jgi:hypothetical protein
VTLVERRPAFAARTLTTLRLSSSPFLTDPIFARCSFSVHFLLLTLYLSASISLGTFFASFVVRPALVNGVVLCLLAVLMGTAAVFYNANMLYTEYSPALGFLVGSMPWIAYEKAFLDISFRTGTLTERVMVNGESRSITREVHYEFSDLSQTSWCDSRKYQDCPPMPLVSTGHTILHLLWLTIIFQVRSPLLLLFRGRKGLDPGTLSLVVVISWALRTCHTKHALNFTSDTHTYDTPGARMVLWPGFR